MRWSKGFLYTQKESPADAEIASHQLLMRGGFIRKLGPGVYTYCQLGLRTLRKFERIIREEMDSRGGVEVLMPMVQPQALWEESGRWQTMGEELLRFKNRNDHGFCLGGTHEEVITDLIRKDVKSYRDLPVLLYQIQTKYRDEIRPRFGLMRGREFLMKDAYSFDVDREAALKSYDLMYEAYQAIFERLGVDYRIVEADAGNIGGSQTHEFQVIAEAGEDHLMVCDQCSFAANIEVAPCLVPSSTHQPSASSESAEKFLTPGLKTINDLSKALKVPAEQLTKTLFVAYQNDKEEWSPVALLLRGCDELNLVKVKKHLNLTTEPRLLTDAEVKELTGAWPGSCGPVGLKIPVYMDAFVEQQGSLVVGANEDDYHLRNVQPSRDFDIAGVADLRNAEAGDLCPACVETGKSGHYRSMRGIETGHIFFLGTKYSESMGADYLDANGRSHPIEMGCYGIGVGRTVQAVVEQSHDDDGIIWPLALAPFHVHICLLDPDYEPLAEFAEKLYQGLWERGVEVLLDDRKERPGVKFKDADLLGLPLRVTLGKKGFEKGVVEMRERRTGQKFEAALDEALEKIVKWIRESDS